MRRTRLVPLFQFLFVLLGCATAADATNLHTFEVGDGPRTPAIDARGNVWVANFGGSTVTEI